jgi:hypothetical protein
MKSLRLFIAILFVACLNSFAQPGNGMPGMDTTLMKLFAGHAAFTAKAEMQMGDPAGRGEMSLQADVAMLDGKMRTEVDLADVKAQSMPPEALAQMKQFGMDRVVSIVRPDQQKMLLIYPGLKSYAATPLPASKAAATNQPALETTELGKETVDGHPCVKNKMIITDDSGKQREFTVWNATDLKGFPIQFETTDSGGKIRGLYRAVQFTKPDSKKFEAPEEFKSYPSIEAMMMTAMQKVMGGAGQ